ncbi:hypothetical protein D5S17_15860 [Pseudonocardiaceae bacterium YIM PH 21723]|nr:hypothetical protein D5S17_15860 [Pseudonocardiaceae bacterium YIM PH 21723]
MRKKSTLGRLAATVLAAGLLAGLASVGTAPAALAGDLPAGAHRIGALVGDKLIVKEGTLYAQWVEEYGGNVAKFEIAGNRIGVLLKDGTLIVKEGDLYASWVVEATGVKDFRLAGNRIGILRNDSSVAVKDGNLSAGWVEQISGVKDLELTPNRVGVVLNDGTATVKEGDLYAGWVNQMGGVADLDLSADRIGVLRGDGSLAVKESNLYGAWVEETHDVTQFKLAGSMIGVVFTNGTASVKEGNLYAPWINQLGGAKSIQISGDRIGVQRTDNSVTVKDGGVYGSWVEQAYADQFRLANAIPTGGGGLVNVGDLRNIYGDAYATDIVAAGIGSLNDEMNAAGITSPTRKAALLATLKHESGFRYNAGEAGQSATYRGRGYIQLTTEGNYRAAGNALGHDFVSHPEDAAKLEWSAKIMRWYWTQARNINYSADRYDMGGVGRDIGYSYDLDPQESLNRCDDYKAALRYFNGGSLPVPDSQIKCLRR